MHKPQIIRVAIFGIGFLFAMALGKVADLMLLQGAHYRTIADENRLFRIEVPASRGLIFDRTGVPLTQNASHFYLASRSAQLLFGNEWSLPEIDGKAALPYLISSPSSILIRTQRSPQIDPAIVHLVGYTGYKATQKAGDTSQSIRVGRTGLEKQFEQTLAGVSGYEVLEISAKGIPQRSIVMESLPQTGKDIQSSIDLSLTQTANAALDGYPGAVVVTQIETSQILAMTSSPTYSLASLSAALKDTHTPLLNRAITAYPPGSTFKLMTALAALRARTITPDTVVDDTGEISVGEQKFGNWYWRQYGKTEGKISLVRAIARSNDIYFYEAARTVGPDKIDDLAGEFGYGKGTGIQISAESAGLLPNSAWKEKKIGEKWYTGDTFNMGIGQGYVLATPVQVNSMTASLGRRGVWCPTTLLLTKDKSCTEIEIDRSAIETVIRGMVDACSLGGTAFPFFPWNSAHDDSQKIACKTGTAEFGGPVGDKGYKRTHGWFTMMYPSASPKVAITVFMESTTERPFLEGSKDAAPVALKVFQAWREKYEK